MLFKGNYLILIIKINKKYNKQLQSNLISSKKEEVLDNIGKIILNLTSHFFDKKIRKDRKR